MSKKARDHRKLTRLMFKVLREQGFESDLKTDFEIFLTYGFLIQRKDKNGTLQTLIPQGLS